MKFALLIASVYAYAVSEGPTKADNGDSEETVVNREADIGNGFKFSGWTNPLSWADDGSADDTVVLQLNSKLRMLRNKHDAYDGDEDTVSQYDDMEQHKKFDWGTGANHDANGKKVYFGQRLRNKLDAYDGDEDTVSQYDDMEQHKKFDWGTGSNHDANGKKVYFG